MNINLSRLPLFLCLCLFAAPLRAQYHVKTVVFRPATAYTTPDLTTLSGLKPGDPLSKSGLLAAAARLQASGYFDDVQATLEGPVAAVEVRFTIKPVAPSLLLPVGFRNFVWLTPQELDAFRQSVPLLSLGLPEAGDSQQKLQTALEHLLASMSVSATLSHEVAEPTTTHPIRAWEYRVDTPNVLLGTTHLTGNPVPKSSSPTRALRQPYNEGLTGETVTDLLLTPYLDAGYVDATTTGVSRALASSDANAVKVDVSGTISAGEPYRIAAIRFAPTEVLAADTFAKAVLLHPGDVASRKLLLQTCADIRVAYRTHGYLDTYVKIDPTRDATAHTVAYQLTPVPGEQYHLKSVTTKNLPDSLRPDLDKTFPLHPGDVYDEHAVANFLFNLKDNHPLAGYSGNFFASAEPNTHQVEVTLEFTTIRVRVR